MLTCCEIETETSISNLIRLWRLQIIRFKCQSKKSCVSYGVC